MNYKGTAKYVDATLNNVGNLLGIIIAERIHIFNGINTKIGMQNRNKRWVVPGGWKLNMSCHSLTRGIIDKKKLTVNHQ